VSMKVRMNLSNKKMHRNNMISVVVLLVMVLMLMGVLVLVSGCQNYRNGPPKTDKPDPGPFLGRFEGDYGSLLFKEDGLVEIVPKDAWLLLLARAVSVPQDGEAVLFGSVWRYTFTMGSTGEMRYDFADGLSLYHIERGWRIDFLIPEFASTESLKLTMLSGDEVLSMDFIGVR
jgi:hypothetical protein